MTSTRTARALEDSVLTAACIHGIGGVLSVNGLGRKMGSREATRKHAIAIVRYSIRDVAYANRKHKGNGKLSHKSSHPLPSDLRSPQRRSTTSSNLRIDSHI
jgi:hypothetical protein